MAPEIALSRPVDGRADLYSLGCVAYYLLTGRRCSKARTAMQVFAQHLQTLPTPPSQLGQVTVPADLEHLILTCLAKKPEDRPQSAAALDRLLAAVDLEPWTDVDARQWWESAGALSDGGKVGSGSVDQTVGQSATRLAVDLSETSAASARAEER